MKEDDYKSLVTVHQNPPNPVEVAQDHEMYDELNQGVDGRQPLEWTGEEYDPSELQEIVGSISSDLDAPICHWRMEINSKIGEDVLDVVPLTQVSGVLDYEFEAKGYGTSESEIEVTFAYDESGPDTWVDIKMAGEMEVDVPDHFSKSDEAAMKRNIQEDLQRVMVQISDTIEDIPQLEL